MKFTLTLLIALSTAATGFSQQIAAAARTEDGWGYVRPDLTWLVVPQFHSFWRDNQYVFNDDGHKSILCEYHEGMARCRTKDGNWGF